MELLVLGGTRHVGRCVVEEAVARGWSVTGVNRGLTPVQMEGVTWLTADRTVEGALEAAVGERHWDAVIDTWTGAPAAVQSSASLFAGRAAHYGYVSSRSVYAWPIPDGGDEHSPLVDGDPHSRDDSDYARCKRGGELAALAAFGDGALCARAGLILGPYEVVGRLPWWLRRLARGGPTLAPGPKDRALQYIDGRDLAIWMLSAAERGLGGCFNAVSIPGFTTMGELLDIAVSITGEMARLVWVEPSVIEAAGIAPWTELPIWLPPTGDFTGLHSGDTSKAHAAGLRCRPVGDTVADTWSWLLEAGDPDVLRTGRIGLDAAVERAVLEPFI